MRQPSYMRPVVDRNVVIRRMTVYELVNRSDVTYVLGWKFVAVRSGCFSCPTP